MLSNHSRPQRGFGNSAEGGLVPNKQTMDETSVRVRLKFQEPDILTSQQSEQGLAQSWYLVMLEDVHTIADVAFDIRAAFHLEESCKRGLSLEVEGFVLPASQPARLLKDSDLIRIKRRTDIQGQISIEARNKYYHIHDKELLENGLQRFNGYHGVELRALDEFEKETGGYESEHEEGEMETDFSLDGGLRPLRETNPSSTRKKEKDRGGKSHKRRNVVASEVGKLKRIKDLGAGQELAIVQTKDRSNSVMNYGVSSLHVKVACDELKKEINKNMSEENGAITVTVVEGKSRQKKLETDGQSTLSQQEKIEKERKKNEVNIEGQGQLPQTGEDGPSSNGVQRIVELEKDGEQKVKRKKLNHSGSYPFGATATSKETMDQLQVKIVEADCEDGLKEGMKRSGKKQKRKDIDSLNNDDDVREGMLKKRTAVDKVGGKKRKKDAELESPSEKLRTPKIKTSERSIPARTPGSKVNGESSNARTPKNETSTPNQEQRPSRSARRKKAKRQWLREQAKMALLTGVDARVSENNGLKAEVVQGVLDSGPIGDEVVEFEAEEEMLPIIVRTGHIRFEPYDEGETQDQSRLSMPPLQLGDQVKTKRQGQNWGQEKSAEKQKGKRLATETNSIVSSEELGDNRINTRRERQIDPISFEKHPALDGAPQEGDILAYRLVELTASWTPEISPYRVGIVAHWENATNMIKVNPHLDYPRLGKKASLEDEDLWDVEEMEVVGPYDENGVLEIEFSSLVEVRLMQRVHSENHEVVPGPSVEIAKDLDPAGAGAHQVNNPTREPVTDIGGGIPMGGQQGFEDEERAECASALHALVSEELERKKMELCQRDGGITNASTGFMAPSETPENASDGSEGGTLLNQPKAGRDRKHKFLKSAGVGSIVALLRAQQAL